MKKYLICLFTLFAISVFATEVTLKDGHPREYVVKKGDTLWDISTTFLNDPWLWPEIWQANPQIKNPHLIYPGDRLTLVYHGDQPRIRLERGNDGTVRLSPQIRTEGLDNAIPAVPLSARSDAPGPRHANPERQPPG